MDKTRAEIANENTTEAHNKGLAEKRLARLEARLKKLESENKSQAMENRSLRERVEILLQSVKGLESENRELRERVGDLENLTRIVLGLATWSIPVLKYTEAVEEAMEEARSLEIEKMIGLMMVKLNQKNRATEQKTD